jgi:hypothetical protein
MPLLQKSKEEVYRELLEARELYEQEHRQKAGRDTGPNGEYISMSEYVRQGYEQNYEKEN